MLSLETLLYISNSISTKMKIVLNPYIYNSNKNNQTTKNFTT